jgi:hypothetical protein
MTPTKDQILRYIEMRFHGQHITAQRELKLKCLFHDDKSPSLTFNTVDGVWCCHAGCGEGGLIDFEQKLNGGSREEARLRLEEVMGAEHLFESQATKPVAIYPYVDAQGTLLFEKCRYQPKRFVQRRPLPKGGYEYRLGAVEKPLYRLPEVIRANTIFVVEGEKDADRVSSLNLSALDPRTTVAATTNFDGAGKWRDKDAIYFAGRKCIVIADNDEIGRAHAERVAESVAKFAVGVRVLHLPNLAEHGDVSDWLDAGHTVAELLDQVRKCPNWKPAQTAHVMLIEATKFIQIAPPEVEYLISGVIPKGANGIIAGWPKAGKSILAEDALLALATGTPWLGFKVPQRVKCALISREDYPGMTAQRLLRLWRGTDRKADVEGWLWLNTRWQTPTFLLEDDAAVNQLIAELKTEAVEFACFDVFRTMHSQDENDNTEMQRMLNQLNRIQAEAGCAIALVHHLSKAAEGSMFRHLRGASAIDGWTQWALGVSITNPEQPASGWIRKVEFETKAACPADPRYFQIESREETMCLHWLDEATRLRGVEA